MSFAVCSIMKFLPLVLSVERTPPTLCQVSSSYPILLSRYLLTPITTALQQSWSRLSRYESWDTLTLLLCHLLQVKTSDERLDRAILESFHYILTTTRVAITYLRTKWILYCSVFTNLLSFFSIPLKPLKCMEKGTLLSGKKIP